MVEAIIIAIIGSGILNIIITAIINAFSNRKSQLKEIKADLDEIKKNQKTTEKDLIRTQLIMMIADYPDQVSDILKTGEHYFKNLDGNWTASNIFLGWLHSRNMDVPPWFEKGGN